LPTAPPLIVHEPAEPALQFASWLHRHADAPHVKPAGHGIPHPPQFAGSFPRSKQPLGPWQHVLPKAHAAPPLHEQALFAHVCPSPHSAPLHVHLPMTHVPPPPHEAPTQRQCPALHVNELGHAFVQPPQCAVSEETESSQPFAVFPSQSANPVGQ
jgi:hypothetical protein